jgi:hypothetical protein
VEGIRGKKLQKLFSDIFNIDPEHPNALPTESRPFSKEEARQIQQLIDNTPGEYGFWPDDCLLWQPAFTEVEKLSIFDVFEQLSKRFANGTEEKKTSFINLLRKLNQVQAYCLDRCWVILFYMGPFFPPGASFLIDHYTKKVIEKRYIDVCADLRKLGYETPSQPTIKVDTEDQK